MKAKSYLFTAASAALLLASCSESEVVEMPASRAIGFSTYVSNTTRALATETTADFLKGDGHGFYVAGKYLDINNGNAERTVFDGTSDGSHLTFSTSWGYAPINYWLDDMTYKFAAYGPAAAKGVGELTFDYAANSLKIDNFTVADGAMDLVVAEGKNAGYTPVKDQAMELIKFKFFHALSKVKFTFVNEWRNTVTLKITDVKIKGIVNKGSLATTGTLAAATAPIANTIWTVSTDAADKADYEAGDSFESDEYLQEYAVEKFLLPQTIPAATDANAFVLEFTAQVNNASGSGPDLGNGAGNAVTKQVLLPNDVVAAWEPGKAYNYTLKISGETFDLKPIQFDTIEITTWVENEDNDNLDKEDFKKD